MNPQAKIEALRGLYAITPDTPNTAQLITEVRAALAGGAALVQYRNKRADEALRHEQAAHLLALCREFKRPLIINDDGVHLGREDGEWRVARAALGPDKILGISCYNELDRAAAAVEAGADYIAFGAMFVSSTKPQAVAAPLSLLTEARALGRPIAAIGGITLATAPQVIAAGADMLAVISDLFHGDGDDDGDDIRTRARDFSALF
jgi:thiamine-phosphate pyrophosphorylase